MQNHHFQARSRQFSSCLEAALFPKNIDTSVYHALIRAVHERLDVLHRYMQLRKRILKLDELHLYDIYVPLTSNVDIRMPYTKQKKSSLNLSHRWARNIKNFLQKGFQKQRWVDRYENQNKRSGAYSSGCYDSMPYILMNYKDILRDVFTLAHEAGHSMHSLYSRKTQPYQYSDYPIFLAEVASTFNEDLLTRLLINAAKIRTRKSFCSIKKLKIFVELSSVKRCLPNLNCSSTSMSKRNSPHPQLLKEKYRQLNQIYFGPALSLIKKLKSNGPASLIFIIISMFSNMQPASAPP